MTSKRLLWLMGAAAAPGVLVVIIDAALLLFAVVDHHPRWPDHRLNLTEAAAVRDNAEVVRLLGRGEDPNVRRPVRPGLLGNDGPVEVTPLEAAVSIRRPDLVDLLFEHGARPSPEQWVRLRCAAQDRGFDDIVAMLEARWPGGLAVTCSGGEHFW